MIALLLLTPYSAISESANLCRTTEVDETVTTGPVHGQKKLLVVLGRYSSTEPSSKDDELKREILLQLRSKLRQYFEEVSYGSLSIDVELVGIIPLNTAAPDCAQFTPQVVGRQLYEASLDYSQTIPYDHILLWADAASSCRPYALGRSRSVYFAPFSKIDEFILSAAHELGHNFGLEHANELRCSNYTGSASGHCTIIEYGDATDIMGGGLLFHPHAAEKHQLGWLDDNDTIKVSSSGVYEIAALTSRGTLPKTLIVDQKQPLETSNVAAATGWSTFDLWLEFRAARGFDTDNPAAGLLSARLAPPPTTKGASLLLSQGSGRGPRKYGFSEGERLLDPVSGATIVPLLRRTHLNGESPTMLVEVRFPGPRHGAAPQFRKRLITSGKRLGHRRFSLRLLAGEEKADGCVADRPLPKGVALIQSSCIIEGRRPIRATRKAYKIIAWNRNGSSQRTVNLMRLF